MEPVGAFTRTADITATHGLEKGLIFVDELPAFFASREQSFRGTSIRLAAARLARPTASGRDSLERRPALSRVPGRIPSRVPRPGHRNYAWPWEDLEVIYLESGFFSASDRMTVQLRSGQRVESAAVQGLVKMVSLDGQRTEHRLSNLAFIAPSPVRATSKPAGRAAHV
jgi:hypothetical protein